MMTVAQTLQPSLRPKSKSLELFLFSSREEIYYTASFDANYNKTVRVANE